VWDLVRVLVGYGGLGLLEQEVILPEGFDEGYYFGLDFLIG
jgi:hypothetical protein